MCLMSCPLWLSCQHPNFMFTYCGFTPRNLREGSFEALWERDLINKAPHRPRPAIHPPSPGPSLTNCNIMLLILIWFSSRLDSRRWIHGLNVHLGSGWGIEKRRWLSLIALYVLFSVVLYTSDPHVFTIGLFEALIHWHWVLGGVRQNSAARIVLKSTLNVKPS